MSDTLYCLAAEMKSSAKTDQVILLPGNLHTSWWFLLVKAAGVSPRELCSGAELHSTGEQRLLEGGAGTTLHSPAGAPPGTRPPLEDARGGGGHGRVALQSRPYLLAQRCSSRRQRWVSRMAMKIM